MEKAWYQKWWGVLIIGMLIVLIILIINIIFKIINHLQTNLDPEEQNSNIITSLQKQEQYNIEEIISDENYWIGSANPKLTIIEFADFNCTYCANSFVTMREISLKYKNDVKIVFKDYPLLENSLNLSLAARCAGEQNKFWEMHDRLFQNAGSFDTSKQSEISYFAKQIGLNITQFNNCLASKKYLPQIQIDYEIGQNLEITGTPTWVINGYKIAGDIPKNIFIQIIEEFLKIEN